MKHTLFKTIGKPLRPLIVCMAAMLPMSASQAQLVTANPEVAALIGGMISTMQSTFMAQLEQFAQQTLSLGNVSGLVNGTIPTNGAGVPQIGSIDYQISNPGSVILTGTGTTPFSYAYPIISPETETYLQGKGAAKPRTPAEARNFIEGQGLEFRPYDQEIAIQLENDYQDAAALSEFVKENEVLVQKRTNTWEHLTNTHGVLVEEINQGNLSDREIDLAYKALQIRLLTSILHAQKDLYERQNRVDLLRQQTLLETYKASSQENELEIVRRAARKTNADNPLQGQDISTPF